jgi:hypothetical protein
MTNNKKNIKKLSRKISKKISKKLSKKLSRKTSKKLSRKPSRINLASAQSSINLNKNLDFLVKSYDLLKVHDDKDYELIKDLSYDLLDKLIDIKKPIIQEISDKSININKSINIINNKKNVYEIEELNNLIDEFDNIKRIRELFEKKYDVYKLKVTNDLDLIMKNMSKNLSLYINKTYFKYDYVKGVSNAYVKLWEIYNLYMKDIMLSINKNNFSVFHTCEAPGNWIKTTEHYIKRFYPNIKFTWYANSLNPNSEINIKKYGNNIFGDHLKYMKNYPERWLFGDNNTGDITSINNINFFSKFCKQNNVMLITNDAGLSTEMGIELMQRLEYASVINTIACSNINGCCIVKHFATSYYDNTNNLMKLGNGYSVNIIYLYQQYFNKVIAMKPVTSNPRSSEYYIIGIDFKGITDIELNKLYNILENFNTDSINQCVFKKEDLNNKILSNINNGIKKIIELNLNQTKINILLWRCHYQQNKEPVIEQKCSNFIKYHRNYEIRLFKDWIKNYNYIPINQ